MILQDDDLPKAKTFAHGDTMQTQTMLGLSPFFWRFTAHNIKSHNSPQHLFKNGVTHSLLSIFPSLSLTAKRILLMFLMCCDALFIRLAVDMEKGQVGIKKTANGKKEKMSKK